LAWPPFFWLGAIRLVFALHAQCFVNSVCHSEPDTPFGEDSSRNVRWLGVMHFFQGENWHRNHHARPALARLGWTWRQPDAGYVVICILEKMRLASDVRRSRTSQSRPPDTNCVKRARQNVKMPTLMTTSACLTELPATR
jgi:fatty-acid desaturase